MLLQLSSYLGTGGFQADGLSGLTQDTAIGTLAIGVFTQVSPPGACSWHTLVETEHVPCYMFERVAAAQFPVNIRQHVLDDRIP